MHLNIILYIANYIHSFKLSCVCCISSCPPLWASKLCSIGSSTMNPLHGTRTDLNKNLSSDVRPVCRCCLGLVRAWHVTAQGQQYTVHIILSRTLGQLEKFPQIELCFLWQLWNMGQSIFIRNLTVSPHSRKRKGASLLLHRRNYEIVWGSCSWMQVLHIY